jgi:mono/diheme cytochrome c family protein
MKQPMPPAIHTTRIHFNKLQRDPWNEPSMNTSTYLPESNTAVAAARISGFRLIIGSTLFAIFAFATSTGFARPAHPAPSTHPVADDGIATQGTALVGKYCFRCHGGEANKGDDDFNVLDHKSLTEHPNGYIAADSLADSYLWQRIADGEMPPKKAKQPTAEEIEIFKQWVTAGAPVQTAPNPAAVQQATPPSPQLPITQLPNPPIKIPPTPQQIDALPRLGQPLGQPLVLNDKNLAVEGIRVINQYCGKCHPGKGSVDFDPSDRNRMIKSPEKILVPGHPEQSLIWEQVVDSVMPPKSAIRKNQAVAVTGADREILKAWITAGAPYPGKRPRGAFMGMSDIWKLAFADLRTMNEADRAYTRYFRLDNVYNNYLRYNDDEYVAHHAALSKICNSLSQEARIVPPHRVDPSGVLWRIDLRDYGWDGLAYQGCGVDEYSAWKLLLAKYPYGVSYSDHNDRDLRSNYASVMQMTGSQMPIIRGDWFVFTAPQDDLYYLMNRIPNTDARLEKHLGVDCRNDFMRGRLLRSAVINSGVSVSNRLMDRHDARDGYYWKSYDFAINAQGNDLNQLPLGPMFPGHPYPNSAFKQDGGEMIYSLPNGMQAYMLIDRKGNRIERGPATVVGDGEWTSGTPEVANAISCMNCHAGGMRFYTDDIRENIAVFGDQQRVVEQLFDPRNKLKQVLDADAQAFRKACYRCYDGVVEKIPESYFKPGTEPIAMVARNYWKELSPIDIGIELGVAPQNENLEQLGFMISARAQGNVNLQTAGLMPITRQGGKLRRETWTHMDGFGDYSLYQDASSEFNIAPGHDCSTSDSVKIFNAYKNGTELRH